MDFKLSEEQKVLQRIAREFAEEVKISANNLLGELGQGFKIMMRYTEAARLLTYCCASQKDGGILNNTLKTSIRKTCVMLKCIRSWMDHLKFTS